MSRLLKKHLPVLLLLCLAGAASAAGETALSTGTAPVSYDYGMEQRRKGDYAGARDTFIELLRRSPDSGGGLEGLGLSCISLGLYDEAAEALQRWNASAPHNPYILGLLARAQNGQRDEEGALLTYKELAALDPRDCAVRTRLDSAMERLKAGVFPFGRKSRSYSLEGLDTANPQRILYEGGSAGSRFRAPLKAGLDLVGGVEVREEAQRNDGRGFTYYDIQERILSAGLNGRPGRRLAWSAEYGRSWLTDIGAAAVGDRQLNRVKLAGEWHPEGADLRLALGSAPKFVRGSGGTKFFRLMRENSARAEAGTSARGWDWLSRAGIFHTTDGTTLGTFSLRGTRESGANLLQAGYSHGQQEFYGASAAGRLQYANTDSASAGLRRYVEDTYRAGVSAARTYYSDNNRLFEADAELTGWLPGYNEFSAGYRFSLQDFSRVSGGYNSLDENGHWLGAYWKRCRGKNWSASAGYEHGFLHDSLLNYQGDNYLAGAEWYGGSAGSLRAQAARKTTTGRGHSWSLGLQARYSFQ